MHNEICWQRGTAGGTAALRDFDPAYDRCHPVGMVLNQLALSEAQWRTEVEKMRTAYKAPIVDKIISYLYDLSHH